MNNKKKLIFIPGIIFFIIGILYYPLIYNELFSNSNQNYIVQNENKLEQSSKELKLEIAFKEIELNNLIYLTHANDKTERIFIVIRDGIILSMENDSEEDLLLFLDIRDRIDQNLSGERGLLGLAFDPNYSNNNYFFLHYNDFNGNTIISRFTDNKNNPDLISSTELQIIKIEQPYSNHNGGSIVFGPDGYLYIALGDGGGGGDPFLNGQNGKTLLGSILRINVRDSSINKPYKIPNDNPFINNDSFRDEIWAYGLRNPWRMSFDTESGRLFVGDVGQSRFEEINIIEKGGNYGWNIMEGNHCYQNEICDKQNLKSPIFEYSHNEGCSVTGGYVYNGEIKSLKNKYIFADFCSGYIWIIDLTDNKYEKEILLQGPSQISSFGEGEDGEIYLLSFDGRIYKFVEKVRV